jgi:hypothetical protein
MRSLPPGGVRRRQRGRQIDLQLQHPRHAWQDERSEYMVELLGWYLVILLAQPPVPHDGQRAPPRRSAPLDRGTYLQWVVEVLVKTSIEPV